MLVKQPVSVSHLTVGNRRLIDADVVKEWVFHRKKFSFSSRSDVIAAADINATAKREFSVFKK